MSGSEISKKFVQHWTGENFLGKALTFDEVKHRLSQLEQTSVLGIASLISLVLGFWKRGAPSIEVYGALIRRFFAPADADKLLGEFGQKFVFSRRQLLILQRLVIEYGTAGESATFKPPAEEYWREFGKVFLGINDQLQFGLAGKDVPRDQKIRDLFVELVPVVEDTGSAVMAKAARSVVMLRDLPPHFADHPLYIDLRHWFKEKAGIALEDFQAICFGILSRWMRFGDAMSFTPENVYIDTSWFKGTAVSPADIEKVFTALSYDVEGFKSEFQKRRLLEDLTPFKTKPLLKIQGRYLPIDLTLLAETLETFPFWTVNATSKAGKLREFWGILFEKYVASATERSSAKSQNRVLERPFFVGKPPEEVSDVVVVHEDSLVLIEAKGVMFSAEAKYSGDVSTFFQHFEKRFVVNEKGEPKGVRQIEASIRKLFLESRTIEGVDLAKIRHVFPLIVSLDQIGDNPLFSLTLNLYFPHAQLREETQRAIYPVMGLSVEAFEFLVAHADTVPIAAIVHDWINSDPSFRTPYIALDTPLTAVLGERQNAYVKENFGAMSADALLRVFPNDADSPPSK